MSEQEAAAQEAVETPEVETPEQEAPEIKAEGEVAPEGEAAPEAEGEEAPEAELSDEQQEELGEKIEEAVADGADVEEVRELIETFKYKANGKEIEETLDWNDKEAIKRKLQLAAAAQPAMQESAQIKKQFEQALQELQENPLDVLREIGYKEEDLNGLAEQQLQQQIEQLKKTPEQLAQEQMEAELEELRAKLKEEEDAKKLIEQEKIEQEAKVEFENQINEALSSTENLPSTPYMVRRMADAMMFAMDNGYPDVTADQVLPMVEDEVSKEYQEMIEAMPDKVLENFMGKKTLERLRKNRLEKAKKQPKVAAVKETAKEVKKEEKKEKKISMREFLGKRTAYTEGE